MPKITDFVVQCRHADGTPWTEYATTDDPEVARRFVDRRTPDPDREWRVMRRTWTQVAHVGQGTGLQSGDMKRRAYKREWERNKRAERKAQGLCVGCGKPVNQGTPEADQSRDAEGQGTPKRGRGRPRTGYRCDDCIEKEQARKDARATRASA